MLEILQIKDWHTPASDYLEMQVGDYRLQRTTYQPGFYKLYRVKGYTWFEVVEPIPIMALQERRGEWCDWMIDDPFNYYAMTEYCNRMHGRVLTSGLGLGLAAHALAENEAVTEVKVVEQSPEVIELVGPYVDVDVVQGDFWDNLDGEWDFILLDIWATKGKHQHDEIMRKEVWPAREYLKERFPETQMVFFGFAPPTDIDIQHPYMTRAVA
jgi:hypothetical protein